MNELWLRLQHRKLVQWALAYAAAAFALLQGLDMVGQKFGWPDAVGRVLIIAACVGFFVTLLLAWYHGDRGAQKVSGTELLLLALLLAIGGGLVWRFANGGPAPAVAAAAPRPAPASVAAHDKSIAVLPFVNMSANPENEYFADGLSEEILNSLARIDGMQVVGRTSSFQFKGKNEDLRVIGEQLGVATVLEGSVRREGNQARITAQLIRTADGIHLWSETYDRTLNDALAVQLDIAEKVAGVLDVVLDDRQREAMRRAGVKNVDAFIAYQKGIKLYDEAHAKPGLNILDGLRLANAEFARASALEPDFAAPHFAAADLYEHTLQADDQSQAARVAAQQGALQTLALAAASSQDEQLRRLTEAERQMLSDDWTGLAARIDAAFRQPGCHASNWLPVFASAFGYGDVIEDFGRRASACDPLNRINYRTRVMVALATGKPQRALAILARLGAITGAPPPAPPTALVLLGRLDDAARTLADAPPEQRTEAYANARIILGRARGESPALIRSELRALDRSQSRYRTWQLTELTAAANAGDRAEANRRAAVMDARPAGPFLLALVAVECQCGAPFDLAATPHFKARLAESGLRWPPPQNLPSLANPAAPPGKAAP